MTGQCEHVPVVSAVAVAAAILSDGHAVRFRAHGQSMRPLIRAGDEITVAPIARGRILRGDILFYRSGSGAAAHRVLALCVRRDGPVFITRGDASGLDCEEVSVARALGVVTAVHRRGTCVWTRGGPGRLAGRAWAAVQSARMGLRQRGSRVKGVLRRWVRAAPRA
jgi:hypothetical protein